MVINKVKYDPQWVFDKEYMDQDDDGFGPWLLWTFKSARETEALKLMWERYKKYVTVIEGRNYSIACSNGSFLEPVSAYAFNAFCAALTLSIHMCNKVSGEALNVAKSGFVTPAGRQVHETLAVGAVNCVRAILYIWILKKISNELTSTKSTRV